MTNGRRVRYVEGQWFAIPLRNGGYATGRLVRGSIKTHGGLGYFFGPILAEPADVAVVALLKPGQALFVAWFGGLYLYRGRWPLINSAAPFRRTDWPVPLFWQEIPLLPSSGWIIEYSQDDDGSAVELARTATSVSQRREGLQEGGVYGAEAIELRLNRVLLGPTVQPDAEEDAQRPAR